MPSDSPKLCELQRDDSIQFAYIEKLSDSIKSLLTTELPKCNFSFACRRNINQQYCDFINRLNYSMRIFYKSVLNSNMSNDCKEYLNKRYNEKIKSFSDSQLYYSVKYKLAEFVKDEVYKFTHEFLLFSKYKIDLSVNCSLSYTKDSSSIGFYFKPNYLDYNNVMVAQIIKSKLNYDEMFDKFVDDNKDTLLRELKEYYIVESTGVENYQIRVYEKGEYIELISLLSENNGEYLIVYRRIRKSEYINYGVQYLNELASITR